MGPESDVDLTLERWRRVDRIFAAALTCPPEERAALIEDSCAGDETLKDRVYSLLTAADAANGFLDDSAVAAAPHLSPVLTNAVERAPIEPGDRVGPYRIIRELGRGGIGTVLLAERDDGHYQRRVALKVLRRGVDTDDVIARFRVERQILASLSHPNIAALLDGGATPDGRPFLVMEWVDGQPITEYCDTRGLGVEDRLRLFVEVSAAVEHAHRNLIVHRDLKPSNILITRDGTVKLLDFGIAKLLNPDGLGGETPHTRAGARLLTPEYASPEQIRGDTIGTATDVYQLGLLLYELLTGQHAHPAAGRSPADFHRLVCDVEPLPPSDVASPDRARQLHGELDAIVLAALRKEPERRYASAERMSADVTAYLTGMPVAARPDTHAYRARKFVRRHPVGTAVAILIALLISGHVAALGSYNRQLEQERDRAAREAQKAERVRDLLVGMFEVADPAVSAGAAITVPELLERGAARMGTVETEPEIHAAILDAMGTVYSSMRLDDQARPVYQRALAVYREGLGEDHPKVADILSALGHIERNAGSRNLAQQHYEHAMAIRVRNFGPVHPDVACSLNNLGLLASDAGDSDTAIRHYTRALEMRAGFVGYDSPCLATILNNLAIQYRTVGDLDRAIEHHREALAMRRQALGDAHPDVARVLNGLGMSLRRAGDPAGAEAAYREALLIHATVLGAEHSTVATGFNNIAVALVDLEEYDLAIALHHTTLALRRHLFGNDHRLVASSLHNLGNALRRAGREEEATGAFAQALDLRRATLGDDDPLTQRTRDALAVGPGISSSVFPSRENGR